MSDSPSPDFLFLQPAKGLTIYYCCLLQLRNKEKGLRDESGLFSCPFFKLTLPSSDLELCLRNHFVGIFSLSGVMKLKCGVVVWPLDFCSSFVWTQVSHQGHSTRWAWLSCVSSSSCHCATHHHSIHIMFKTIWISVTVIHDDTNCYRVFIDYSKENLIILVTIKLSKKFGQ